MKIPNLDFLNKYSVKLGTAITVFLTCLFVAYKAGISGWEGLNAHFIDTAEAADHITWTDYTILSKRKNVEALEEKVLDYKVSKVYAEQKGETEVVAQYNENILKIEARIEREKEAIECLEKGNKNCEL